MNTKSRHEFIDIFVIYQIEENQQTSTWYVNQSFEFAFFTNSKLH